MLSFDKVSLLVVASKAKGENVYPKAATMVRNGKVQTFLQAIKRLRGSARKSDKYRRLRVSKACCEWPDLSAKVLPGKYRKSQNATAAPKRAERGLQPTTPTPAGCTEMLRSVGVSAAPIEVVLQ
ncbi:hypothetical protein GTU79_08875 [Sodalis ligni]|uniref:hypothetical protein n=1 Tax=Sodalis ligni TaxID=2697027 RepID=UPI00193EC4B1|nr:hypothetical protein [Sodalis ligni]QWA12782.1 hypothetical protein GTU79_08875 [Sodalis ligni]